MQVVFRCCAGRFDQFSVQQFPFAALLFGKRVELLGRHERADRHMSIISLQ